MIETYIYFIRLAQNTGSSFAQAAAVVVHKQVAHRVALHMAAAVQMVPGVADREFAHMGIVHIDTSPGQIPF